MLFYPHSSRSPVCCTTSFSHILIMVITKIELTKSLGCQSVAHRTFSCMFQPTHLFIERNRAIGLTPMGTTSGFGLRSPVPESLLTNPVGLNSSYLLFCVAFSYFILLRDFLFGRVVGGFEPTPPPPLRAACYLLHHHSNPCHTVPALYGCF